MLDVPDPTGALVARWKAEQRRLKARLIEEDAHADVSLVECCPQRSETCCRVRVLRLPFNESLSSRHRASPLCHIGQWQLEGRKGLRYIGGVDVSFIKGNDVDACACLVVLEYPSLQVGPSLQHQCAAHSARLCMRTLRWCS